MVKVVICMLTALSTLANGQIIFLTEKESLSWLTTIHMRDSSKEVKRTDLVNFYGKIIVVTRECGCRI